jgi:citrate lyase subunit beta/citryl-CoA lyase
MPSSNARALEKAQGLPADAVIFDLEDAVAPDAKVAARDAACAAVTSGAYGRRTLTIRCNGLDTPWGRDDLAAAAAARPDAVVLPKTSGRAHLDQVAAVTGPTCACGRWSRRPRPCSPCGRSPRTRRSTSSSSAPTTSRRSCGRRSVPGRAPLVPHLATVVLAAREAGVDVLDGVFNDVRDLEGFEAECRQGVELGFDGKTLVHPSQVEVANRVWAPDEQAVEHARRVIAAFEQASREGRGVVTVDGRMVEHLHVDDARRVLATAEAVAALS